MNRTPPATTPWQAWTCAECASAGRRGTCAPRRCYCGHKECHAFASWHRLEWRAPNEEGVSR